MNHNEEVKLKTDGLDSLELIHAYAKTGFGSIHPDHFGLMRWYGAYQQKPNQGHFMLRVKIGGGQLTAPQLRELAALSHEYGRDVGDITTRQNIQLHWLTIETLALAIDRIQAVGLTTTGACGDVTRNIVGCPAAGLSRDEITDATPILKKVEARLLGNRAYSNLPRKFKISISGCHLGCPQPQINDIGLTAVRHRDDPTRIRYDLRVGGGLSTTPRFARGLGVLLEEGEIPEICELIVGIFRDYGNRENRKRARMKFLVDEWGIERFRNELEDRLGHRLNPWEPNYTPPTFRDDDHVGIHPQKGSGEQSSPSLSEKGKNGEVYVGIPLKVGRFMSPQMAAIAQAAEQYGRGRIRLTNHQNVMLLDLPADSVESLCADLRQADLEVHASQTRRLLVACTGSEFCNLALTETKELGAQVVERLEQVVPVDEGLRIHISGCPNSCGQFQTGDIGMTGLTISTKDSEEKIEAYNLFAGGGYGTDPAFGRRLAVKVPKTELPDFLAQVYQRFTEQRVNGETFQAFCSRLSDEELLALGKR
jgi:sulfite reductase beta subunit-like hemoprotein